MGHGDGELCRDAGGPHGQGVLPGSERGSTCERELGRDGQGVEDGRGGVDVAMRRMRAHARRAEETRRVRFCLCLSASLTRGVYCLTGWGGKAASGSGDTTIRVCDVTDVRAGALEQALVD